ncbi:hypothetical protein [Arcicella rigui]|uniref:Uncharacterized protein n=1 Tax=Arcicella rigui TaxID=797020 RepID=A0ABU5QAF1_9BACT|nr:hypothetical protein [Arcicella rigui]MEA5139834.1 hypothetical protein [Arcicella rigui]
MVHFTKDSIVITIKSVENPFRDWQMMNQTFSELLMVMLSNKDIPINDYETFWFVLLKSALSELDISAEQTRQINELLTVAK